MNPDILPMLRCPHDGSELSLAPFDLVEQINQKILAGTARDQLDQLVNRRIDGGLINATGDRLYPIRDGIPTLIIDDSVRMN